MSSVYTVGRSPGAKTTYFFVHSCYERFIGFYLSYLTEFYTCSLCIFIITIISFSMGRGGGQGKPPTPHPLPSGGYWGAWRPVGQGIYDYDFDLYPMCNLLFFESKILEALDLVKNNVLLNALSNFWTHGPPMGPVRPEGHMPCAARVMRP